MSRKRAKEGLITTYVRHAPRIARKNLDPHIKRGREYANRLSNSSEKGLVALKGILKHLSKTISRGLEV